MTWVRKQVEMLLTHAIENDAGHLLVPHKYADPDAVIEYAGNEPVTRPDRVTDYPNFNRKRQVDGWFEFGPLDPVHMAHVYADSLASRDLEVIRQIRDPAHNTWDRVLPGVAHGKCLGGQNHAWLNYLAGAFSDYPVQILLHSIRQVFGQLEKLRGELEGAATGWGYRPHGDKAWEEVAEVTRQVNQMKEKPWTESVTHSYFQTYLIGRSTIVTEALVQLTMGGPLPVYNGGLLKVAVRHFDAAAKRPGLPPDVAALVNHMEDDAIDLTLANTNPMESRRLIVQAGAFAEHRFTTATYVDDEGETRTLPLDCEYVEFELGPGTVLEVHLGMERFCRQPSYQLPWER